MSGGPSGILIGRVARNVVPGVWRRGRLGDATPPRAHDQRPVDGRGEMGDGMGGDASEGAAQRVRTQSWLGSAARRARAAV